VSSLNVCPAPSLALLTVVCFDSTSICHDCVPVSIIIFYCPSWAASFSSVVCSSRLGVCVLLCGADFSVRVAIRSTGAIAAFWIASAVIMAWCQSAQVAEEPLPNRRPNETEDALRGVRLIRHAQQLTKAGSWRMNAMTSANIGRGNV